MRSRCSASARRDNRRIDGYVDIHAHVLPGIDDGPADLDGSLAMSRSAAESGIATIVATPHLRSDFPAVRVDQLAERCEALRETIGRGEFRSRRRSQPPAPSRVASRSWEGGDEHTGRGSAHLRSSALTAGP